MSLSAGTLLYRKSNSGIEVLLVHPSGAYNKNAPWGVPKGIPEPGEQPEDAARRETLEEAGVTAGKLEYLGQIKYTSGRKVVQCFYGEVPPDTRARVASWEIDAAEFVPLEQAKSKMHRDQSKFIDLLIGRLGEHFGGRQ